MKNIPKTLKSFEADVYIISSTQGRELFRTIFNRFLWQIYKNIDDISSSVKLDLNIDYLSKVTQMNKKTIQKHRTLLCETGLIKVSRSNVEICLNYYLSLVSLFSSIEKDQYRNFSALVELNDLESLNNMGFRCISNEEMKEMVVLLLYPKSGSNTQKWDIAEENENNTQNWGVLPQNTPYYPSLGSNSNPLIPKLGFETQKWDVTQDLANTYIPKVGIKYQNWDVMLRNLLYKVGVNTQNWDVRDMLEDSPIDTKLYEEPNFGILESVEERMVASGAIKLIEMLKNVVNDPQSYIPSLGIISPFLHPTFTPRIRNNNKQENKEINNKDFLDFEGFEIDGVELKSPEPFGKNSETTNGGSQIIKSKKFQNPYSEKKSYSREEFKNITAPLEDGENVESPVRLFFYIFWWGLWDLYSEHYSVTDYDNEGNAVTEDEINDLNMIDSVLPVEDIMQLLQDTYENLEGAVSKKCYEDRYGKYQIGFEEFEPFNPCCLLRWKESKMPNGDPGLVISLDGIVNIDSEEVKMIKAPASKEEIKQERKRSFQMIKSILTSAETDLTPIELVVRRFLDMFGNFDEYYHMNGFKSTKRMTLPGNSKKHIKSETVDNTVEVRKLGRQLFLQPVIEMSNEAGIDKEIFFQSLNDSKQNSQIEEINSNGTVFSYTKIANINLQNGWKSNITDQKL